MTYHGQPARAVSGEAFVTFPSVTITLNATSPRAAYARLCELLDVAARTGELEYTTDTFVTEDGDERSTEELFGE